MYQNESNMKIKELANYVSTKYHTEYIKKIKQDNKALQSLLDTINDVYKYRKFKLGLQNCIIKTRDVYNFFSYMTEEEIELFYIEFFG